MTTMREDIRSTILLHAAPMRPAEVADALPQHQRRAVSQAIISLYREGVLSRVKREDGSTGYYASKNLRLKPMSTAQKVFTQTPAAIKAWPAMTLPPPPAKPRPESVEEFLANGGEIQVLPGIQVKPLTYGGHRDQNNDSMRRSLHE